MLLKKFGFVVLFMAQLCFVQGQINFQDTVFYLDDIEIQRHRTQVFSVGSSQISVDSLLQKQYHNANLSDVLSALPGIALTSYGPGGLSSISIRGAGASHTPVYWNGLNIQSPMSGGVNLSLFPVALLDSISVQYGGASTLLGSGAISGSVHLSNVNLFNKRNGVTANVGMGSYGAYEYGAGVKLGNAIIAASINAFARAGSNDFEFENTAKFGSPIENQSNAGYSQWGTMADIQWKPNTTNIFEVSALFASNDKDVQTLMTGSRPSEANQVDQNLMLSANYNLRMNRSALNNKIGFINTNLVYTNPNSPDSLSENQSLSFIEELDYKYEISRNQLLNIGFNYTHEQALSDGFTDKPKRNRTALFGSYKLKLLEGDLVSSISFRTEAANSKFYPLVYSLGVNYNILPSLTIVGSYSKNYRLPSFNDLFWKQSAYARGNADLLAESGWSGELGLKQRVSTGLWDFSFTQTIYYNNISNWIVWLPDGAGIWAPENKDKGLMKGAELNAKVSYKRNLSSIVFQGGYTLTNAKIFSDDEYDGKPAIYIPKHMLVANLSYTYSRFSVFYRHSFQTERYYDSNNTLEAYQIGDLSLGYRFLKESKLNLSFKINNLWNANYQVMAWYAMPMRNYQLSAALTF